MLSVTPILNKTILVAGGAGYIGMHTTLELLKNGYKVVVLDNFSTSTRENYDRLHDIYYMNGELELVDMDIRDKELISVLEKYENIFCVIHFAAYKSVGESVREPLKYYDNNINSTISLLKAMKKLKIHNLIFSSSASVYGIPTELPITEEHVCNPQSPYGRTKYFIEEILKDVAKANSDLNIVILRYFNPVGSDPSGYIEEKPKGIPENLMPYVIGVVRGTFPHLNVYGDDYETVDGTGVRDYIHITDLTLGHIAAISLFETDDKEKNIHTYNLGTGKGYSVLEMVKAVENVSGKKIQLHISPRRPGDVPICYADTSKALKEMGWKAKYGLEDMCKHSL